MTNTVTKVGSRRLFARRREQDADVDITSYTNGGESVAASDFGLRSLDYLIFHGPSDNDFIGKWDSTAGDILCYSPVHITDNDTPNSAAVNVDATDSFLEATTSGNVDVAVALTELANTTDAGVFRVTAVGN